MVKLKLKNSVKCFLPLLVMVLIVIFFVPKKILNLEQVKHQLYYLYIVHDINVDEEWLHRPTQICEGTFTGYGNEFAILRDVEVFPETHFKLKCASRKFRNYQFTNGMGAKNHLNQWLEALEDTSVTESKNVQKKKTIFVLRYEYANLYHQMTDFYNAFLVAKLLKIPPDDLDVVLTDRNSPSVLDKAWDVLFGNVTKVKDMKEPVFYKEVIWAVIGYNSPMNFHSLNSLPYVEEFSHFFKTRYNTGPKVLDCAGVSILFVWRRNYVAHPGNPSGTISRKIKNEKELIEAVQEVFPGHSVAGIQLDEHEINDQVKWVSQTDILVGMHGAGMSHIMELPYHAGVLELFPTYKAKTNRHFRAMARWRGLHYRSWQNINPNNEFKGQYTRIPPIVVTQHLLGLYRDMCGSITIPAKT
ncbi:beta-(1,2)-xylosyltransferase-like [Mizuhopecten yessoensis]|uniref:Beta-(1,2)-xylosyltransferase n=1 Tax=Mizuhopecten yessoensis TaxID=6573 RepID=A0A210R4J0_MIZYE|nr:beta-(1,2)-xylosyltransferase-like [Mizuhopecten yessoensis]OWF55801.1 Beta-(1,2)-xylosyltransferase [Mizuhopecten yessoensis]